nr:hypothetical protein [uncultured Blautia sp.]
MTTTTLCYIENDDKFLMLHRVNSPCLKTILLRVLLQAVMIAGVLMAVKYLVGGSRLLNLAVITYMSSPATFSMQTFLRKKESSAYASTTNSLYCVVSILVYITLAVAG